MNLLTDSLDARAITTSIGQQFNHGKDHMGRGDFQSHLQLDCPITCDTFNPLCHHACRPVSGTKIVCAVTLCT